MTKVLDRFQQPIQVPGPRVGRTTPLEFVRRALVGHTRRALNLELALVPCIDFMLCVVLFLLSSFSVDADCCIRPVLEVPGAVNVDDMIEAPVVAVTANSILVDGTPAGTASSIVEGARLARVDELYNIMRNKRELWKQINAGREFPGTAILQIDRNVPSLVVKSVFQTVAFAGYPKTSFMVERRGKTG